MTATAVAPSPTPATVPELRLLPLEVLRESPLNPRRHWNEQEIQDLAASLAPPVGMIEPMVVRPHPRGAGATFEIVAGAKRFRAAKVAGLTEVPCLIRTLSDPQVIALMVIENNQRGGLHPLDEAQGFADWMKLAGVKVPAIADQLGHSIKYVYDRLKLLELTPEAKSMFLEGRFEAGHAILLARLTPAQQKQALDLQHGGLFAVEDAAEVDEDGRPVDRGGQRRFGALVEGGRGQKPASVREFATWINDRVRLTEAAVADPVLFPEQAAQLAEATERKLKVIHISVDHQLHPDARLDGVRTYGPMSWAYADGQEHRPQYGGKKKVAKTCAHAVLGLVVAGEGRGGMFQVCIAKEKCQAHWPEQYRRAQERKAAAAAPAKKDADKEETKAGTAKAPTEQPWEREERQRKERRARWQKVIPEVRKLTAEALRKAPLRVIQQIIREDRFAPKNPLLPRGTTADEFLRYLAATEIEENWLDDYSDGSGFERDCAKVLGLNLKPILAKMSQAAADTKAGVKEVARFKGAKKDKATAKGKKAR